MVIKQKLIRNLDKYLPDIKEGQTIQMAVPLEVVPKNVIKKIGFGSDMQSGDRILPLPIGPISRFNANGRCIARKDLPKEERYIMTRMWRWKQFAGRNSYEEREEEKDYYRECYQRELISPPAEELTYFLQADGSARIVSREFIYSSKIDENLKHIINLFLEIFGECHILNENKKLVRFPKTRILNWKLLPKGVYPWQSLKPYVDERLKRKAEDTKRVIYGRQENILSYVPDVCCIGTGGFQDYVAYVFKGKNLVVLESIQMDNAIYIFNKNWEQFSKLTKAEVISNNLCEERIVHTKGWQNRLDLILRDNKST